MAGPDVALELTVSQARVLGALLEKELVTPDSYPMTLNALVAACNQTSNREPIIHFEAAQVETAALTLKSKGLLRVVYPGAGERATKYRQVADEALELTAAERALVCLLLLRGAQTTAELRARADRLHAFESTDAVEALLRGLAGREEPLVARIERLPGQKEARWIQLLEAGAEARAAAPAAAVASVVAGAVAAHPHGLAALEQRVAALEELLDRVIEALGDLVDVERPPRGDAPPA